MTATPAPAAAEGTVVKALKFYWRREAGNMAHGAVAALARADMLCEPGTAARVAALEAVADALVELRTAVLAGEGRTEAALRRSGAALDALDAVPARTAHASSAAHVRGPTSPT